MMPDYFNLEEYVKGAIRDYPPILDILKKADNPMASVAVNLHENLLELNDDWSGVSMGMLIMYVWLTYRSALSHEERLVYIA